MKRWLPGCSIVLTCLALMCLLCGCDGQPITDDTGRPKPLFAPMPQFNPPGGAFAAAVTVEITCADSDAAIYYTTDGSTPSDTNGTLYTGPIVLATTTTLQACAYVGASMPSLVASGVYTIASNAPPTLGNATVIGSPRPGSDTSITILCTATDADGYVKSVVADLSSLGGVTAQQMVKGPGGQWNWSGTVRAATAGRKEIRLTAADNQGALASTVTYVDATAPLGMEKWRLSTQGPILSSPAIAADGTIYVGSSDRNLYALAPDGSRKWSFPAGSAIAGTPAIGVDGTVYFAVSGKVYAVTPSGSVKWSAPINGDVYGSVAIGARGMIYVGATSGTLSAFNANGTLAWQLNLGSSIECSPSIDAQGTVHVGTFDGKLHAIYAGGRPKWTFSAGSTIMASPAIGPDGTVYVGAMNGTVYAINPDGTQKWGVQRGAMVLSSAAIDASNTLYVGANNGTLAALDVATGTIKWEFLTAGAVTSSPALAADGTVYFGSADGTMYAVDSQGKEKWRFKTQGQVIGSAAIASDGTVYIGSADRQLYAIAATVGPASGPWPTYRAGQKRTGAASGLPAGNISPIVSKASATGTLVMGRSSSLSLSCYAVDPDGLLTAVTADLSQIGGPVDPQPLTNTAGDVWSLSTAVVAPQLGVWPVKIVATDDSGDTVETIWQVTVVGRPAISNIEFFANPSPLNGGIESEVTVRCIVVDPQDALVPPVLIDLSDIGGPAGRAMVADATVQNRFVWTGHVTPQRSGNRQITIRATNMDSLTSVVPHIEFVDNEPKLSNLALTGVLLVDTDCTITLSCSSVDVDGRIQQVTADLSNIGGSAAQALQPIGGGQYRWTGTVRPLSYGFQDIPLTVQYDPGIAAIYPFTAKVVYANPIGGQDVVYSGELLANNAKTITVRCGANDPAEIQQIWADLSWLGGSNVQVLTNKGGNTWSWTGEVWPSVVGDAIVTFTATTTYGTVVTVQKVVTVTGTVPLLSSVQMTGSVLADLASPLTITCRAEDPSGITGVKADLSELGVPAEATFAFNSVTGLWVWSGTVMPTTFGDKSITITAAAGSGMTNTVTVTVPVHAASKWAAPLSLGGVVESSPAVSPDGSTVYIGSGDGNLYAVNDSGTVKWSRSLGASVQSSPAVSSDGSMIYVGSGKDSLYAITAENNQAWSCPIGSRVYSSPALSPDELTVYVGADDGNVYAVDAALGTIKAGWPVAAGGKVVSSPAVSDIDGTVYVGSYGGQLHAINPDGAAKWAAPFQAAGLIWSSPAIGRSPNPGDPATSYRVYFASFGATPTGSTLYALDQDGNEKWSFPLGGTSAYSSPVIGPDGTIYIGSDGGKLYAIDPQDGLTVTQRKKWECTLDGAVRSVPAVGQAAGRVTVYVGTSGGTLYAVDPADGSIEWSFQTGDQIRSSVLLTSDGSLYVASYDWNLYAIDVAGGPAPSSWPMFRGGQLRQGLPQ